MIRSALFGFLALASTARGLDPQSQAELLPGVNDTWNLRWWGVTGRSYFLQASDDLQTWHFAPLIEGGNDEIIEYETGALGERYFTRVVYTDQTAPDLDAADFDGDNLSNLAEITEHHTHPLIADSDHDGLTDDWEIGHGFDPNDDGTVNPINGGDGDPDGDGVGNIDEQIGKTNPTDQSSYPARLLSVSNQARASCSQTGSNPYRGLQNKCHWKDGWGVEDHISVEVTPEYVSGLLQSVSFPGSIVDAISTDEDKVLSTKLPYSYTIPGSASFTHRDDDVFIARGVNFSSRCWLKAPPKSVQQEVKMVKVVSKDVGPGPTRQVQSLEGLTFIVPPNSEYSSSYFDLSVTGVSEANEDVFLNCWLLAVDGMVSYPGGQGLAELDENVGDGALISLERLDSEGKNVGPVTRVGVDPLPINFQGCKVRFRFDSGDRYVVYKDLEQTQVVTSETTEFDANEKNVVYLVGKKLSASRGAENIVVQLGVDGVWVDADLIKATVIQSEFV